MAERLLTAALRKQVGDRVDDLYHSHGAGTGAWHIGDSMNPPAARQVTLRGGDPSGFRARKLSGELVDESDLVLCATSEHVAAVLKVRPDARSRTFVLGEFGRLLAQVGPPSSDLPLNPAEALARGVALVAAVDAARAGADARAEDDLEDPWGMRDEDFESCADEIEQTVVPLARALTR